MRLTLDWDRISKKEFERRLEIIKREFPLNDIEVMKSPSGKGYHIIVYNACSSFEELVKLRKKFWDDEKRLGFDIFKRRLCELAPIQILFDLKFNRRSKLIYKRTLKDKLRCYLNYMMRH